MRLRNLTRIPIHKVKSAARLHPKRWFLLDKTETAYWIFAVGMFFAILASIHISPLWKFATIYPILASPVMFASMLLSNSSNKGILNRRDILFASIFCFVILVYQNVVNGQNIFAIILSTFKCFIFIALFRLDKEYFERFATHICKWTSCLIAISYFFFLLYLFGVNLPSSNTSFADMYYFTNYRFFLINDKTMFNIFPRFHSVFLEPGHMGTFLVLLLATQINRWKRWYNVIMLIAVFASFSLAAYVLLILTRFLHLWIDRKKIVIKGIVLITIVIGIIGGSYIYKDGDNIINQLIAIRLEMNETGDEIKGNNRVSSDFKAEFNSYMQSGDIFFGREMDNSTFGNAGYRVYLYDYGIVGFILLYIFYLLSIRGYADRRAVIGMLILSLVNFWIRAYPLMYAFYIPYYLMANLPKPETQTDTPTQTDNQPCPQ